MVDPAGSVVVEIGGNSGPLEQKLAQVKALLDRFDKASGRATAPLGGIGNDAKKAEAGVNALAASINNLAEAAKKAEGSINNFVVAAKKAEGSNSRLTLSTNVLAEAVKAGASAFSAYKIAAYIKDSTLLAARFETMGIVMRVAGENAGYTLSQMEAFSKELQKSGISMLQSRDALTQLATANLDLAAAAKLGRSAQDLAVVGNTNSSAAMARMIYGIKSAQTETLRTLGLNVQFEQGYEKLAATLGTTSDKLTEQQRVLARTNTVFDAAAKYSGIYEASMTTAGKMMGSLTRLFEDFQVVLGATLLPAFSVLVFATADAMKFLATNVEVVTDIMKGLAVAAGTFVTISLATYAYSLVPAFVAAAGSVAALTASLAAATAAMRTFLSTNPIGWAILAASAVGAAATAWFVWGEEAEKAGGKVSEAARLANEAKAAEGRAAAEAANKLAEESAGKVEATKASLEYIKNLKEEGEEAGLTAQQVFMLKASRAAALAPTKALSDEILRHAAATWKLTSAADAAEEALKNSKKATEESAKAEKEHATKVSKATDEIQIKVTETEKLLQASRLGAVASKEAAAAIEVEAFKREALAEATDKTIDQITQQIEKYSQASAKLLEYNKLLESEKRIKDATLNLDIERMRSIQSIETSPERINAGRLAIERQIKMNELMAQYGSLTAAAAVEELRLFDKTQQLREVTRFWEEVKVKAEGVASDISTFLVDGLVNATEGGKNTFENMWDAALSGGKRFLANLAVEILKQKFILPITTAVIGGSPGLFGVAGASGQGGGGAGGAGLAGANLGAAGLGVLSGPSAMLSNGIINFGLSTGAYGVGAGQAIASAVPYVGAFVAAVGLAKSLGLIGGKTSVGANAGGRATERGGQFFAEGIGGDLNGGVSQIPQVQSILDNSLNVINTFVKAAGLSELQTGEGVRAPVQLFASGKNLINSSVDELVKALAPFIEGLTKAQQASIQAASGLDGLQKVLDEITAQRAFPLEMAAARKQLEDPRGFAIDELNTWRDNSKAFAATLESNAQVLSDIDAIYAFKLKAINEQFSGFIDKLGNSVNSLPFDKLVETQNSAFAAVDKAAAVLFKSVSDQRTRLEEAYKLKVVQTQTAIKNLSTSVNSLTTLSNTLKSALSSLDAQQPVSLQSRAAAQASIRAMLDALRSGGTLPDQEKLTTALETLKRPSEDLYSTFLDYQRDFIRTKNDITELSDRSAWQLSKASNQLDTLNRMKDQDADNYELELRKLDETARLAQDQIAELKGTTIAVLSVRDAIDALAAALLTAGQASGAVKAVSGPVTGLYNTLLGRAPDVGGREHFQNALAGGQSTLDVAQNIIRSEEFANVSAPSGIVGLYNTLLGRAPDVAGLAYWEAQQAAGQSLQEIALNFTRGQEYADLVKIRGYADGGVHKGGFRRVGEGFRPEIEWTPPSLILSSTDSKQMVDMTGVINAILEVKGEVGAMRSSVDATQRHSKKTSDILIRVTRDGESLLTTAA